MYQPTLGRFLSRDPLSPNAAQILYPFPNMTSVPKPSNIAETQGYSYVANNPINSVDPSGLQPPIGPGPVAIVGPALTVCIKVCQAALEAQQVLVSWLGGAYCVPSSCSPLLARGYTPTGVQYKSPQGVSYSCFKRKKCPTKAFGGIFTYGCYCGRGNIVGGFSSAFGPLGLDEFDQWCALHDDCYGRCVPPCTPQDTGNAQKDKCDKDMCLRMLRNPCSPSNRDCKRAYDVAWSIFGCKQKLNIR
jgi:RHS repeat-associated protein